MDSTASGLAMAVLIGAVILATRTTDTSRRVLIVAAGAALAWAVSVLYTSLTRQMLVIQ